MDETNGEVEEDIICIVKAGREGKVRDVSDVDDEAGECPKTVQGTASWTADEKEAGDNKIERNHEDKCS